MKISLWIESLWQDFRYGARLLRINPGYFAVAAVSLALGIGANTAIFELLDAVRLRMLPVAHPEQLAELHIADNPHCCSGNFQGHHSNFTYAQWEQIRDHQQAFSGIFAWGDRGFNIAETGEKRIAQGLWVSGNFFSTLGVRPLAGRLITEDDDRPGCGSPGVVISSGFWQREFAGNPRALGGKLPLDGHPTTVIGITPPDFFGVDVGRTFDVAVPICAEAWINAEYSHIARRDNWWLDILGRLKPGWTIERAAAQMQAISPAVFESTVPPTARPDQAKWYVEYKLTARPGGAGVSGLRRQYEQPLNLLLGIAGLVLLIACANLANLTLARASTREREMAIRLAVGAGRARLIRQLLAESFLLTMIGAGLGALLARWSSRALVSFLNTGNEPLFLDLQPDWRVLAFTAAVAVLTCVLFGLAPALRATRTAPGAAMKSSGRGLTAGAERFGLRRALVASQVALSLVLLFGALLFIGTLQKLMTLDAGLRENGILIASVDMTAQNIAASGRLLAFHDLLEAVRATPGVDSAATVRIVPISGNGWNDMIEFPGQSRADRMVPWFNMVSRGYFETMGIAMIAGRDFNDRDTTASPEVAIVNEEFCRKFLNGANPLGREFRILGGPGRPQHLFEIVGLVKNSKYQNLRDEFKPLVFLDVSQDKEPAPSDNLVIRSGLAAGALLPAVKGAIERQDSQATIQFEILQRQVQDSLVRERLMATLSGFFGFLAAALATIGLYGVISYMVAKRRNEIGIRIALGASRSRVLRMVLREAGTLVLAGLIAGTALAMLLARAAASLLYGLRPNDPWIAVGADLLLATVAILASFFPAWRAARMEPMTALREE